jgi:hypothetical protein
MAIADHHCHAQGCATAVPPKLFMCPKHWRMVPKILQRQVWANYVPGQEISKTPTSQYLDVTKRAIAFVASVERDS